MSVYGLCLLLSAANFFHRFLLLGRTITVRGHTFSGLLGTVRGRTFSGLLLSEDVPTEDYNYSWTYLQRTIIAMYRREALVQATGFLPAFCKISPVR